jgi:hypothetical protein
MMPQVSTELNSQYWEPVANGPVAQADISASAELGPLPSARSPPQAAEVLGGEMQICDLAFLGDVPDGCVIVSGVARALRMEPLGDPLTWECPTVDGRGGYGRTVLLRIADSDIKLETFDVLRGGYLTIRSCKAFSLNVVLDFVREAGLVVYGRPYTAMLSLR